MDKSRELYSRVGDNSSRFEGKTVPLEHTVLFTRGSSFMHFMFCICPSKQKEKWMVRERPAPRHWKGLSKCKGVCDNLYNNGLPDPVAGSNFSLNTQRTSVLSF